MVGRANAHPRSDAPNLPEECHAFRPHQGAGWRSATAALRYRCDWMT